MAVAKKLLTAEEFWQLPDHEDAELIDGEVVSVMPTTPRHGAVVLKLSFHIQLWMQSNPGGYIGTETGIIVGHNPDRVKGPDLLYLAPGHIPEGDPSKGFWEVEPDLVVEVISPNENAVDVRLKLRSYLNINSRMVVLIYPDTRELEAHTPDGMAHSYGEDDTFDAPDILPGFSIKVGDLFKES